MPNLMIIPWRLHCEHFDDVLRRWNYPNLHL